MVEPHLARIPFPIRTLPDPLSHDSPTVSRPRRQVVSIVVRA